MTGPTVVAEHLVKKFKRKSKKKTEEIYALDDLSFATQKGEIFGIIGPNGSGKTTTIKIFSTLIEPDSGTATVMGHDVVSEEASVKPLIGVSVGEFSRTLYWRLTGRENLLFFARLKDIPSPGGRVNELLEFIGLSDAADQSVMEYSMGMKHKLSIANALLTDPPVILLDEPLTGIDPISAFDIKHLIRERMKDKTIIWTSHNLYEIEEMCDRIAIINRGAKIVEGVPDELKKRFWGYEKLIITTPQPEAFSHIESAEIGKSTVTIQTANVADTMTEVGKVAAGGIQIISIQTVKPSLEDIFVDAISKGAARNGD
ncbi:MAG: ABC transporter ATP-binding protein [Candidatus Thermoplasmatota archaeon]|nr:ABC transporter ATP-binding protein [Euryarchaeota archaeon]MBU4031359.1 ABC transporter ATP-binding protein [Candidatus Thermoplasmatota archaeon]MBU4070840.1 ABC transporter ATP-binding protein [Candidatus Thermoplasmatota archaeon]MBU4143523.1 ABC transporter ATP-binding protein [Candidatus Thermoplasmatota archaeon]MBU4591965.1 ABC transporter ATP-binding protein [Candidatus Thermoplasmatota archaeon]